MKDATSGADPATFEIVKNSLYKIAEEMRVVLAKTAYSPILKSAGDFSCGLFDAKGSMVAQGPDLPIHLGSMPDAVRAVVAAFGADVHDGDVFILDAGLKLYQWNGTGANKFEKAKALEVIVRIKDDERGGRAEINVIDAANPSTDKPEFWAALGGKGAVRSADQGGSDEDVKVSA